MPKRVLVVDDDLVQRRTLEETIKHFGYAVAVADTGDKAIAALQADASGDISLVLIDLAMPRAGGMAVLSALRSLPRRYPAIVQTADGNIEAAMAAMGAGAVDFVVKPVSPERLEVSIKNALRIDALEGEINRMKASARGELGVADLIAGSEAMARVVGLGRRAAQSSIPVLIEGESGVGKALIARAIHGESARSGKPFVSVNCGAIPESEIEGYLFGQVPGKPGKLIEADQGTLFIEEIGALPLQAQTKLLRVLQAGDIETFGITQAIKVDVRLIAATNQDLIALVREGRLREDLFYRLNVFPIWVPPLRDRLDDVAELVRLFIARFAAEEGKRVDGIEPGALAMLRRYSWPGNIRQLENAVFRAVALADAPMLGLNEFPQVAAHVEGYRVTVPAAPAPKASSPRIEGPVMLGNPSFAPATIHVPSANGRDAVGIPALSEEGDIRSLEAVEADMIRLAFGRYRGRMTEIA
ncbi:MAG TPA: sigma-54 dependent transcriptional regulator, partial [Methyloceanibacter sp.]|nr:sigma-54 dependent transcriptional regulator [Methyloceanibacter sp.]